MKLHELKIEEKYLIDIHCDLKKFEIRKNDRDYQVGDLVRFQVARTKEDGGIIWIPDFKYYRIIYVLKDVEKYGLKKGYCIFGFQEVEIKEVKNGKLQEL